MDLIKDFAYLLPLRIASDMLCFDRADEPLLLRWADVFGETLAFTLPLAQDLAARRTLLEMRRDLPRLIRHSPLSRLGETVDEDELFANVGFLLAAAHDTTAGTLGAGMRTLLLNPDQLQRLCDDPSLLPNAAEELLRCESPVQWTARRAMEDLQIAGQKIARGEIALVSIGAANRDPRQFDDPDRLDITRSNADRHIAFGGGAHYCLGAAFGRIELQVGIAALIRLRNLRLDPDAQPQWRVGTALRALRSLPVLFDA
jgi:cytochrome P450